MADESADRPTNPTPSNRHQPLDPPPHHPHTHQFRFTPPSAVISGCLGLALYDIMGACSNLLQVELESTLRSIEVNMYVACTLLPLCDDRPPAAGRLT